MGKKHLIAAEAEGDQRSLWGESMAQIQKEPAGHDWHVFYPGTGHHSNSNHYH